LCTYYGLSAGRVIVVQNGCDHERFHAADDGLAANNVDAVLGDGAGPYVLCAGGNTQRKNIAGLLHGFARFRTHSDSRHHLVVTGVDAMSPKGARYLGLARDLGIHDLLMLPGHLPDETIPALYRRAQAVVVPSLYEGFGLPVIEAMASGTPTLVSKAASLPEVAGDAALYMDATSPDGIADGLARILHDEPLRDRLRVAGLERAATFTWERCARETIAVYEDVVAQVNQAQRQTAYSHRRTRQEGVDR
jgi:glycosyltransferase involved in cell wall biosynthesis